AIRIQDQADTRRLYRDLMKGYNKFVSPLPPQTGKFARDNDDEEDKEPLFTLTCDQIILINLDESSGVFSVIIAVVFQYFDPRLSWQPEYYSNISSIYVRWDALWIPPLTPISCQSFSRPQFDDMTHAQVSWTGEVEMNLVWQLQCNCTIDRCYNYFTFADGSNGKDRRVDLITTGTTITNDVWYTTNNTAGEETFIADGEENVAHFFTFSLRRSSTYYLIFTILPTFLQSVVSVLGMLAGGRPTKEDIPTRIALGVGSLTSIIFILSSMTSTIPKKQVPVLALFVIIEMMLIVAGIILLAANPARLFLLCIPKEEKRAVMSTGGRRWRFTTRTRVLLFVHSHIHTLFMLLLLAGSFCNLGLNVLRYYSNE
ncbi:hypothetical protein PFISCL1PPCAC_3540, partial [Pristionchus fissidentatus]